MLAPTTPPMLTILSSEGSGPRTRQPARAGPDRQVNRSQRGVRTASCPKATPLKTPSSSIAGKFAEILKPLDLTERRCLRLQHDRRNKPALELFRSLHRCEKITAAKRCILQPGKSLGLVTTNGRTNHDRKQQMPRQVRRRRPPENEEAPAAGKRSATGHATP